MLTCHLPNLYQELYIKESFEYAAQIYNRSPHTGIENEYPYGKYFKRVENPQTEEEIKYKEEYLKSQPAHLFLNIQRTLPRISVYSFFFFAF